MLASEHKSVLLPWIGTGILWILFAVFVVLHFYGLSDQQLVGDEAAPMLLIDQALDAFSTRDWRWLAYPFLWYHEPFREIFSGAIVHWLGVDRVLIRLPSILADLVSFWLLVYIFRRERVARPLLILMMAVYTLSAHLMIGRLAFADGIERLLLIWIGDRLYLSATQQSVPKLRQALWWWLAAFLTMLNAVVLLPAITWVSWSIQAFRVRRWRWQILVIGFIALMYMAAWLVLPYLAYRFNWQDHYINRGLWYYLSRVGEGVTTDLTKSWRSLQHYSSPLFAGILLSGLLLSWTNAKARFWQWLTVPAWLAVLLLHESSYHITTFIGLFFIQTVWVYDSLWKNQSWWRGLISAVAVTAILANGYQLYFYFLTNQLHNPEFQIGHTDVPRYGKPIDAAVKKLYVRHQR